MKEIFCRYKEAYIKDGFVKHIQLRPTLCAAYAIAVVNRTNTFRLENHYRRTANFTGLQAIIMGQTERSALLSVDSVKGKDAEKTTAQKQLKKSLGASDVFAFAVSSIIGAGIYVSPGLVARYTNNMGTSLILWTIAGIVCLLGVLCFCELAIALKKTGSQYLFIKEAFGNLGGFCSIWAEALIAKPSGYSLMSVIISEHIVGMFADNSTDESQWMIRALALSCLFLSCAINCVSTSFTARTQRVFCTIQLLGMGFFVCIGTWKVVEGGTENYRTMFTENSNKTLDFNSLSMAFVSALFSYDGWGATVTVNEELLDVNRQLRLGVTTGMVSVIISFLLLNLSLISTLTYGEMGLSNTITTKFIEKSIGAKFAVIVPIIVALSAFGSLNGETLAGSRNILSAARDGIFPKPLSFIHYSRCTPVPALMFQFSLSALWIIILGSQVVNLLTYYSVAKWVTYGAGLFGVIVLRIRQPDLKRPYKVWLMYPIIASIVSCYIIIAPAFKRPVECVICFCAIVSAIPIHYVVVYCLPESANEYKIRAYSWMLDRFPLAECVFEENSNADVPLVKESEC